jgi:hypothetical protein
MTESLSPRSGWFMRRVVFNNLGPSHFESRINAERRARNLATQPEAITGSEDLHSRR